MASLCGSAPMKAMRSFRSRRGSMPSFREVAGQVQRVAGQDVDDSGAQVLQEPDLPLGVARTDRDGHHPQLLGAVVKADASGEQAVAHHVLENILLAHPGAIHAAGDQVGPLGDVPPGVEHHRRVARGPGGGVQAHHLLRGYGQEAVRESRAQLRLAGQRQLLQGLQAGQSAFRQVGQDPPVMGRAARGSEAGVEQAQLVAFQLPPFHGFQALFPVHAFSLPAGPADRCRRRPPRSRPGKGFPRPPGRGCGVPWPGRPRPGPGPA